ncbi:aminoglycoside phosphotransferase family protein [Qipengyuania sp. MTN3-11]|uniref:aminoglycoside phosphotransferase family protein n=1 Tax=Qipengyuania sp. MTN3-11 TaxID=3056557 RepID=UPI0036F265CA
MTALPDGIDTFLHQAGWSDAAIEPLPGDASFRRYFRLRRQGDGSGETAMLMHAPPPHEDPGPFLHVALWLASHDMRGPAILAQNPREGWVLIEDFGDRRMREWIDEGPGEELPIYATAIDTLVGLHRHPPGPFSPYDMPTYLREVDLFTEWYCAAAGLDVDEAGFRGAWEEALEPLLVRQHPGVTVLRDYHAENIMLPPDGSQGLIDFQDAVVGHPAYDLVSLLQDARRDVSPELERAMIDRYVAAAQPGEDFEADYARLGAQRNAKIVGIFTRLHRRDGKPRYLSMIPRVWRALERDLEHHALAPVARWFDTNIPRAIRESDGGDIA